MGQVVLALAVTTRAMRECRPLRDDTNIHEYSVLEEPLHLSNLEQAMRATKKVTRELKEERENP